MRLKPAAAMALRFMTDIRQQAQKIK